MTSKIASRPQLEIGQEEKMECHDIVKRLDAWADQALAPGESQKIARHLKQCPACEKKARALAALCRAMDSLPPVPAPAGFSRKVCQALYPGAEIPDLAQWWRHLTLTWRSAVCGAALAGLICGVVLGNHLAVPLDTAEPSNPYQSLYETQRIYP